MKKNPFLFVLCFAVFLIGFIISCKKNPMDSPPTDIGTKTSFTEEFDNVNTIMSKGWILRDNSSKATAPWSQGVLGTGTYSGKFYIPFGFTAYSYTNSQTEYTYSFVSPASPGSGDSYSISSWLITPVLSVKNGDKISFYIRGDTAGTFTDRMQVLMNKSASSDVGSSVGSTGSFKTILYDINSSQASGGFPIVWTKYEYTFSGISGKTDTRIAFRHYVSKTNNSAGVGIDLFNFQVN